MAEQRRILVTGATGRQGGAVARHLLGAGFPVRILARNPSKPAAEELRSKGAEVFKGDLNDFPSLVHATAGMHGVFSVQNYWEKGVGYEGEVRQGKNLAEAAKRAGVAHFVQASVADADKAPGVEHFECKADIEKHLRDIGVPHTVLGEVFYLENFLDPKGGAMMLPVLGGVLKPDTKLHVLSVEDIGAIATAIFQNPEIWIGQTIDIAGDMLTVAEMRETYAKVTGKQAKGWKLPALLVRLMSSEIHRQLTWNNSPGWHFGLEASRHLVPEMTTFEGFLRKHPGLKL